MSFNEELREFLDTEQGFAISALYNAAQAVDGIFSSDYTPIPGELADVESSSPRFGCKADSLPSVKQGDTLQIDGVIYDIVTVQPDGTGWLHLVLMKQ